MKTYNTEDGILEVVDYTIHAGANDTSIFTICDGEHQNTQFTINNLRVNEIDDSLIEYDLNVLSGADTDAIKPLVDNIILGILYDQIGRAIDNMILGSLHDQIGRANENQTTE